MADAKSITVGILIYEAVDQLDVTGPFEVLAYLPGAQMRLVAKTMAPVRDYQGMRLMPDCTLDEAERFDVVHVPAEPINLVKRNLVESFGVDQIALKPCATTLPATISPARHVLGDPLRRAELAGERKEGVRKKGVRNLFQAEAPLLTPWRRRPWVLGSRPRMTMRDERPPSHHLPPDERCQEPF